MNMESLYELYKEVFIIGSYYNDVIRCVCVGILLLRLCPLGLCGR